ELTKREWGMEREFQHQLKRNIFASCGIPSPVLDMVVEKHIQFYDWFSPVNGNIQFIHEGHSIKLDGLNFYAIRTYGHAEGHLCLFNETERVLISGDHILSNTSPNVSYHMRGDENPLKSYLNSLHELRKLDIQYVIPGHGSPFTNCNET